MAIQAQMYPENLGLPISSQDWLFMGYNNINNVNNNNVSNNNNNMSMNGFSFSNLQLQQLQYQQQQQQELLQQQYMVNFQQKNESVNNNSFSYVSPTKKQKLSTVTPSTTPATTTASTITSESGDNNRVPVNLSQCLSAQLEKQRIEIDRLISIQNERLKMVVQEQRKQQFAAIINRLEQRAMQLLRQKDDEIADATKKTIELQEIMRKMELEKQAWQRVAAENESMVISLSNTLEQLKEQQQIQQACSSSSSNQVDDAESCCNNVADNKVETGENRGVYGCEEDKETGTTRAATGRLCKVCNSRSSCMLILPCRHLSSCKDCEAFLDACPLCKLAKMASIEALISS